MFRKYDHLVRLGHRSVDEITMGKVWVFPKLDGTNASVWLERDKMQMHPAAHLRCASRRRVLSLEDDNAGFMAAMCDGNEDGIGQRINRMLHGLSSWILYGEWMVPHTLKTYREDTWRRFWIFDVYDRERGTYVPYEEYQPILEAAGLDYIEPLCTIQDPSEEQLRAQVEMNTYLIAEGAGVGEGVVLKNYEWRTSGRPWAKIVRNVFKEEARRKFGHAEKTGQFQVEVAIAEEFVTPELVGKTRAKVAIDLASELGYDVNDPNWQHHVEAEHRGRVIPQLLGRVWHDLIDEEMWAILKTHKGATIDFKKLQGRVTLCIKALAEDLF